MYVHTKGYKNRQCLHVWNPTAKIEYFPSGTQRQKLTFPVGKPTASYLLTTPKPLFCSRVPLRSSGGEETTLPTTHPSASGALRPLDPLRIVPGPHWGTSDPPAPYSCIQWQCVPLFALVYGCVLVTTSAARQTPGGPSGTTEPEAGS